MSEQLPEGVPEGINSHVRHIEQVAAETSASQSSLLRQLSELEAALQLVQKALPDKQFEEQLQRFEALQQRIQSVYDQLKTVEARTSKIQTYLTQPPK